MVLSPKEAVQFCRKYLLTVFFYIDESSQGHAVYNYKGKFFAGRKTLMAIYSLKYIMPHLK